MVEWGRVKVTAHLHSIKPEQSKEYKFFQNLGDYGDLLSSVPLI